MDGEENMAVTGGVTTSCLKRRRKTYSYSHVQANTQLINIQSTIRTAPDLCKNVSLQCYLVATVNRTKSVRSQMCVCVHTLFII